MKRCCLFLFMISSLVVGSTYADLVSQTQPEAKSNSREPRSPLDSPIGTIYQMGSTFYDLQHNAAQGRSIAIDSAGGVHVVWTNGSDPANSARHVFYNALHPQTGLPWWGTTGIQVDQSFRAGFANIAVLQGGWAFPVFHEQTNDPGIHMAGGMDYTPFAGAWTITQPAFLYENNALVNCIWPKIAIDANNVIHTVSMNSQLGTFYYSRGLPTWIGAFGTGIDWQEVATGGLEFLALDASQAVTQAIACSKQSSRIAIAYTRSRPGGYNVDLRNSDLFLCLSEDGGLSWSSPANLTHFTDADSQKAFSEVSVIFDNDDNVHIAFTTNFFIEQPDLTFMSSSFRSRLYHWSESTGEFSLIASDWSDGAFLPGAGKLNLAIPSLSLDRQTGNLYCTYQKFTQNSWSWAGFAGCDAWLTVSTDGGQNWSTGRNVTDTTPFNNPAGTFESLNERDISSAEYVTYAGGTGYIHLLWELDYEAGTLPNNEGVASENPVYYQRIPVDEIPLSPLVTNIPLHDGLAAVDDLTILIIPETDSYALQWSPVPTANQYKIYHSASLDDLFLESNFLTAVGNPYYVCTGCVAASGDNDYFGVIAIRISEARLQTNSLRQSAPPSPQQ